MDILEIPNFKVKKEGNARSKKEYFLPQPDKTGRITFKCVMNSMLGQIAFFSFFIVGALGYGIVQKPQYRKHQARQKAKIAEKSVIASNKPKEKAKYDGDLSNLPTPDKGGDSLAMTWGYVDGKTPEQRAKEAAEAKAKKDAEAKAEQDAQAKAEADAKAQEQAAMPHIPAMPSAPAAQVARAPSRPIMTKHLASAGGLSGGIMRSFEAKTGGISGAAAPAAPKAPAGMPPGMDPAVLAAMTAGGVAAPVIPGMPSPATPASAPGVHSIASRPAAVSHMPNASGAGSRGLGKAMTASGKARIGNVESGSNFSAQAFDNGVTRKEGPADASSTAGPIDSAQPAHAAASAKQSASGPLVSGAELKDCGSGQWLEECLNASSGPEPKDPSAPLVAALNLSSVGLAALVITQSVLHKKS